MAYMPGEDGRVAAVDIASPDKPPAITSVGSLPNKLAISADGKVAVVMNYFGMSVSILDLVQFNEIKAVAMTGLMLASIAITPDGKFALVGCGTNIMIIDIAKQELSTTKIGLGYSPQVISITPNGQYALVTNSENSFASVIDIANLRLLDATIAVGSGAASIAHTREGRYALVANEQSNDLTLIDLSRLKPMGNIPVGDKPFRIAIAPDASAALLLKSGSGGLWRI
jgi:YVTN family beta-propeller protein